MKTEKAVWHFILLPGNFVMLKWTVSPNLCNIENHFLGVGSFALSCDVESNNMASSKCQTFDIKRILRACHKDITWLLGS